MKQTFYGVVLSFCRAGINRRSEMFLHDRLIDISNGVGEHR